MIENFSSHESLTIFQFGKVSEALIYRQLIEFQDLSIYSPTPVKIPIIREREASIYSKRKSFGVMMFPSSFGIGPVSLFPRRELPKEVSIIRHMFLESYTM